MTDSRSELSRLILDGLMGRTQAQLWKQLQKALAEHGDKVSWQTFSHWITGTTFPATWERQIILADVVGGPCGEAIAKLQAPPFRGYRKRAMEQKEMTRMFKPHSGRDARQFPLVTRIDEGGKTTKQARIACTRCGRTYHHLRRNALESEDYFRNKGWEVGNSSSHDYCDLCVAARKVVVKMEDHVKNNVEQLNRAPLASEADALHSKGVSAVVENAAETMKAREVMTREDGRLISRLIEDHWDETMKRYHPGWSDVKLAQEVGKPIDWVSLIRERDFGGVGEDPALVQLVQEVIAIRGEGEALQRLLAGLESASAEYTAHYNTVKSLLVKYKDAHLVLQNKVNRLSEVADKLPRPFKAA